MTLTHFAILSSIILGSAFAFGKGDPFLAIYKKYFPKNLSGYNSIGTFEHLQTLTGDTILLDLKPDQHLYNVYQDYPDTLWLKDKRPKKPKEGKHYLLSNYYMPQRLDKDIFTTSDDIRQKPFGVVSVKGIDLDSKGRPNGI